MQLVMALVRILVVYVLNSSRWASMQFEELDRGLEAVFFVFFWCAPEPLFNLKNLVEGCDEYLINIRVM
jgi:hypothetical protein